MKTKGGFKLSTLAGVALHKNEVCVLAPAGDELHVLPWQHTQQSFCARLAGIYVQKLSYGV